jgi:hypothetical protein
MRNVMVLGSGRSGTSMVAGTLAQAGWFAGSHPYPARASNPKGFFESPDVNGINEYLLAQVSPASEGLGDWQHWLCRLPPEVECRTSSRAEQRIRRLVEQAPWCFKDPRLCYTLPVWRPFLDDTALVCVFRDPAETAVSIVKECAQEDYLRSLPMDFGRALDVWQHVYRRILDRLRSDGDWLFLHYEQVLSAQGLSNLESFVDGPVARGFPESSLRRSRGPQTVPDGIAQTYRELCELASWRCERESQPRPALYVKSRHEAGSPTRIEPVEGPRVRGARLNARSEIRAARLDPVEFQRTLSELEELFDRRLPALARLEQLDDDSSERAEIAANEERILELESRRGSLAWPIATTLPRRALTWPDWTLAELETLLQRLCALQAGAGEFALCLRFDSRLDGHLPAALERLSAAYSRVVAPEEALEVVVLDEPIEPRELPRLGMAVAGWIELASSASEPRRTWLQSLRSRELKPTLAEAS